MTDLVYARHVNELFEQACRYAELLGGVRGWLDATTIDPRFPDLPTVTPARALTEIRRLVDQVDTEHTAASPGGERP